MNINEFQRRTANGAAVVVDFWAAWCAPCRVTKPILEKIAGEYAGRVDFLPVDADASPELLQRYRVYGIPSVLAFRGGQEAARIIGARGEADYRTLFESLAEGRDIRLGPSRFDRFLRLGAGLLLVGVGDATGTWLLAGAGLVMAFLGVYDRCPVWRAVSGWLKSTRPTWSRKRA